MKKTYYYDYDKESPLDIKLGILKLKMNVFRLLHVKEREQGEAALTAQAEPGKEIPEMQKLLAAEE